MAELVDLYNADGEKIGTDHKRGDALPDGVYHKIINVMVVHQKGDILVTQRSAQKDIYPGYYEASAGGVVQKGETPEEAAIRELYEETHIESRKLTHLSTHFYEGWPLIVDDFYYLTDMKKDNIYLDRSETREYTWKTLEEVDELMAEGEIYNYNLSRWKNHYYPKLKGIINN